MAGFILYKKLPVKTIKREAVKAKKDIAAWFVANPKRRNCNAEVWYGQRVKIKRSTIDADVDAAMEEAIQKSK